MSGNRDRIRQGLVTKGGGEETLGCDPYLHCGDSFWAYAYIKIHQIIYQIYASYCISIISQ